MDVKKDILWRVYLCFLGMIILGTVVLSKAFFIQRVQGKYWKSMGDSLHLKYLPVDAQRGTIYSEDGSMLSTSVPVFDIYIDFGAEGLRERNGKRFRDNIDSLSRCLSRLFNDKTAKDYQHDLQFAYDEEERYYPLRKKVSFLQYQVFRDLPLVREGRNKSGVIIEAKDRRINPFILLANRTIGLSKEDPAKNIGLEQRYDSVLKGRTGQRLVRYIAGAYMPVDGAEVEPENGKDIVSTLDTYMQDVAESALMKMLKGNNSLHGTAIIMETATGKIKAIANLGLQKKTGLYAEDLNYGIGKRSEPGSIFKLATLMSLLEDKYVNINTEVNCGDGSMEFYGLTIRDSHPNTGTITVKDAFVRSSNVAFAKLADKFYNDQPLKFTDHLHNMHLDTLTGVDITAASGYPIIKKPGGKGWNATTIPYMAHGYEELVTPLNMLMLYNAVANNGRMMQPYLVSAVRENGVEVKTIQPKVVVEKICSDETLAQLRECLKAVVDSAHGTAHKTVYDTAYSISGKTGTAVTADDNKGYNKSNKTYQASFIGYFPSEQPRYTMAVVIQNSLVSQLVYGADVAGTVFKAISDKIYSRYLGTSKQTLPRVKDSLPSTYYGIHSDWYSIFRQTGITYTDSTASGFWRVMQLKNGNGFLHLPPVSPSASDPIMPNVVGMGLKDAVYLLENKGMKVTVRGRGRVLNQSLAAGANFSKTQNILLILN